MSRATSVRITILDSMQWYCRCFYHCNCHCYCRCWPSSLENEEQPSSILPLLIYVLFLTRTHGVLLLHPIRVHRAFIQERLQNKGIKSKCGLACDILLCSYNDRPNELKTKLDVKIEKLHYYYIYWRYGLIIRQMLEHRRYLISLFLDYCNFLDCKLQKMV